MKINALEYSLEAVLKRYQDYLWTDYLPFIARYIYDAKHGGFFWHTSYAGEQLSSTKRTWYDARGAWVYAYLYRNLKADPTFLKQAKQTIDLLLRVKDPAERYWPWSYAADGSKINEREGDIYGNLFVAEALLGYAEASGEPAYYEQAKAILMDAYGRFQQKEYTYRLEYSPDANFSEAQEVLGHYMILLHLCTGMLKFKEDPEIAQLADVCVEALTVQHYNADLNLMPELGTKEGTALPPHLTQFVYLGHAIESLWMLMDEASRRKDENLFALAAERFKFHVELAWDDLYGGFFHCLDHADENRYLTDKVLWAQEEVLWGCMLLIEAKDDAWAKAWFQKTLAYVEQHFIREDLAYKPWKNNGKRKMDTKEAGQRIENYHHPRQLLFIIQSIERILNVN
ncbi:AGE family epimerase/isomerase [Sphingobacterium humi]|nr:AGE family epimerase/isomerase [Sphingobacterium humi]